MGKFRKLPVVIEAEQFNPNGNPKESRRLENGIYKVAGTYRLDSLGVTFIVQPGDWIVTGITGEKYPVKDEVFKQIYERADQSDHAEAIANEESSKNF